MKALVPIFIFNFIQIHGMTVVPGSTLVEQQHGPFVRRNCSGLLSVQALWKNGERNVIFPFPNNPYSFDDPSYQGVKALGQLTPRGKETSFNLGKYIRTMYDTFLSSFYTIEEIYVKSSMKDRTMMTAAAVLAGLYPPTLQDVNSHMSYPDLMWQPIPVFCIDEDSDSILGVTRECPVLTLYEMQFMKEANLAFGNVTSLFKYLSDNSGSNVESMHDIYKIWDTVFRIQEQIFNLKPPVWAEMFRDPIEYYAKIALSGASHIFEIKKFSAGPLFYELVTNFENAIAFQNPTLRNTKGDIRYAKFYGFSGDEFTIENVLGALDLYDYRNPPSFNSVVFFELFQKPGTDPLKECSYIVKLLYKQDNKGTMEYLIPGCGECTLTQFKNLIKPLILDRVLWDEECKRI